MKSKKMRISDEFDALASEQKRKNGVSKVGFSKMLVDMMTPGQFRFDILDKNKRKGILRQPVWEMRGKAEWFNVKKKRKRGTILDLHYFVYILLMIAVFGLITVKVMNDVADNMDDQIDAEYMENLDKYANRLPIITDQLFMLTIVGVCIIVLVGAFMVNSSPIFYMFFAVILAVLAMINRMVADIYDGFATELATEEALFTAMPFIMSNFPFIVLIISGVIAVVMYSKR